MPNTDVDRSFQETVGKASRQAEGLLPRLIGFTSSRQAHLLIPDQSKLPVEAAEISTQNAAGQNRFLIGYSELGGPDVLG